VGLESLNGVLSNIATMYVWRDEQVPNFPLVHNGGLEFGADFIVKDLKIAVVLTVGEAVHDGVIGGQLVFVRPVNIRGAVDCIAEAVGSNCDGLVAAVSLDGESPCVIGVKLGRWEVRDVELVSGGNLVGLWLGTLSGSSEVCESSMASGAKRFEDVGLGLVECKPWHVCLRWPLIVVSEEG
jgi:hypothetical protein